jgi:hypothetical protein
MHPKFDGELPDGWQGGDPVTKYWNGNYIHLYRVTRPCATCGVEISIDVTKHALDGSKKNAGLLLRNCPKCRAERKAGGPGSRGGTSRPIANGPVPVQATIAAVPAEIMQELETLRTANATMKEELEGLYLQLKELRGAPAPAFRPPTKPLEPATYRRLPEPLTMAEATKRIYEQLAKNNTKMPWEGG